MRREGWESRLALVIQAARYTPYELGTHDCFRVACRVVEALTGVDRWHEFAGYTTKREALALIASHGSSFEAAFDWLLGPRWDVRLARRGDLCCVQTEDGEKHLGVCLGREVALTAPEGLIYTPLLSCLCCWRIG